MREISDYHKKRYSKMSAFPHTEVQESKMQKEMKRLTKVERKTVNKSELLRRLVDQLPN